MPENPQERLIKALTALSIALTWKLPDRNMLEANINRLLEGDEFYLPDGGYSRLIVRSKARLTDNSLQKAKDAFAANPTLVAEVEQAVLAIRGEWE